MIVVTLKRLEAPKFWKIERKTKKFVVRPMPGPHSMKSCLPLSIVIRDMLKLAYTRKEVKTILNNRVVKVDGRIKTEESFPIGLMDIVSVGEETYRVLPDSHGLTLKKADKKDSNIKLLRIEDKIFIKKGNVQLNLHDGRNIAIEKSNYKTNDVLVFDIDKKAIKDVVRFENGSKALIIKGNNIGSLVAVNNVIITKSSMPNQAVVGLEGRNFTLPVSYLFVVGKESPIINLGD